MTADSGVRHVMYVTGTRSDYGLMRRTLKAIDQHPQLRLSLLVTGMHLLKEFGSTVNEVIADGFAISQQIDMLTADDTPTAMARAVGTAISNMADIFEASQPDFVLLEGDRGESLAAAIAAAHMNIPVAHISGGDVSGTIDESIRHSITKFAHLHFPGTWLSAHRIASMGEDPWRIHMVGTPGVDLKSELSMSQEELAQQLGLDLSGAPLLVLQHPVTTEAEDAPRQMRETMEAISTLDTDTVVIYPNSDAGGREMIRVIQEYEELPHVHTFQNLPRAAFVSLMSASAVIIGNSSSALTEAPDFGVPAVNVGTRQQGRERGNNVVDVNPNRKEILQAIRDLLKQSKDPRSREEWSKSPYKDTNTAAQIAQILSTVEVGPRLIQKRFYDGVLQTQQQEPCQAPL